MIGWHRTLLALSLAIVASSCGSARRGEPLAPEFVASGDTLARGEQVFYRHCHQCHAGGESALGPAINNKPLPGWLMRTQVRYGLGVMPAFSEQEIGDRDLDNLIAYLVALRRRPTED